MFSNHCCLIRRQVISALLSRIRFSISFAPRCCFRLRPCLKKIAVRLVPDGNKKDTISELDDRLLATPAIALEQCERMVETMAEETAEAFKLSMDMLTNYDADSAGKIRKAEDNSDHLEDIIGTYLTKLSRNQLTEDDSAEVSKLLKAIGDFERISDHSVNILESAEELQQKKSSLPDGQRRNSACFAVPFPKF